MLINRENGHLGSHIAFLRGVTNILGLGYEQSTSLFGFGPGTNVGTPDFHPTYLAMSAAGNVGIGIPANNSPLALLDVNGVGAHGLGAVNAPSFSFRTDLNTGMWSSGADTLNFSTGGAERIRIDNVGNVGIGTANPQAALDIQSDGGAILVPRKSTNGDPAIADSTEGMIYYNTFTHRFRFYGGSPAAWGDAVGAGGLACSTADTGVNGKAWTGRVTLPLLVGGRNICEDPEGCTVRWLFYSSDNFLPSGGTGANFWDTSPLMMAQVLVNGVHYMHATQAGNGEITATNGGGSTTTLISNNAVLATSPTSSDELSLTDSTASWGFRVSVCD